MAGQRRISLLTLVERLDDKLSILVSEALGLNFLLQAPSRLGTSLLEADFRNSRILCVV